MTSIPNTHNATPFFSILLPTRNRSEIVGGAIQSVIEQSESEWELVISDNDESPDLTRLVAAAFAKDPRVRYIRTSGNLSMHDNWENALKFSRGSWILVLEDKQRLAPQALNFIRQTCQQNPDSIVSYPFIISSRECVQSARQKPRIRRFSCETVVEEFCRFSPLYWKIFPRGLTSCAPRHIFENARRKSSTGLVFSYINPDYASGFQLLSQAKDLVYIDEPIIIVPPSVHKSKVNYSNGKASMTKQPSYDQFLNTIPILIKKITADCPIPSIHLWPNLVIYDFHHHYNRSGHKPKIHRAGYQAQCLMIIIQAKIYGTSVLPEIQLTLKSFKKGNLSSNLHTIFLLFWRSLQAVCRRVCSSFDT
jgi:glycosyltransferase involved in cell wall biosynthesis